MAIKTEIPEELFDENAPSDYDPGPTVVDDTYQLSQVVGSIMQGVEAIQDLSSRMDNFAFLIGDLTKQMTLMTQAFGALVEALNMQKVVPSWQGETEEAPYNEND
jgi:hypothetical protein